MAALAYMCANAGLFGDPSASAARPRRRAPLPPVRVLPGEFEPVARALVGWDGSDQLVGFFGELVAKMSWRTPVTVLLTYDVTEEEAREVVISHGGDLGNVQFLAADTDSVWVRDYGPLVLRERHRRRVVDFRYFGDPRDDSIPEFLSHTLWSWKSTELRLHFEGGNLQSDGAGRCLTTSILLTDNPDLSESAIRRLLRDQLGCRDLLILPAMSREPTGHVDMFATITGPGQVLVAQYKNSEDLEDQQRLDDIAAELRRAGFRVRRVPMPENRDGLFRSYTNAIAVNGAVFVPVFSDDTRFERAAIRSFQDAYPGREIVPIDSSSIMELAGAVHCVTMTVSE